MLDTSVLKPLLICRIDWPESMFCANFCLRADLRPSSLWFSGPLPKLARDPWFKTTLSRFSFFPAIWLSMCLSVGCPHHHVRNRKTYSHMILKGETSLGKNLRGIVHE